MKTLGDQISKLKGTTSKVRFEAYELRKNMELKYLGSRKDMLGAMKLMQKAKEKQDFLSKEFRVVRVRITEERVTSTISEPYTK